jgi:hypothetical protein
MDTDVWIDNAAHDAPLHTDSICGSALSPPLVHGQD